MIRRYEICDPRPKLDLTRLKSYTEDDWKQVVVRVPFLENAFKTGSYLDYRDSVDYRVFAPKKMFKTATESAMTMLRTLNFTT